MFQQKGDLNADVNRSGKPDFPLMILLKALHFWIFYAIIELYCDNKDMILKEWIDESF